MITVDRSHAWYGRAAKHIAYRHPDLAVIRGDPVSTLFLVVEMSTGAIIPHKLVVRRFWKKYR